eukprot:1408386-Karenia_brevis.AAC.1
MTRSSTQRDQDFPELGPRPLLLALSALEDGSVEGTDKSKIMSLFPLRMGHDGVSMIMLLHSLYEFDLGN